MAIWIVSAILVIAVILLITEKIPVDVTAVGIIVALMITQILHPREAVQGFANPAVITVGAMFLVSKGMIRTGVVGFLAQKVIDYSKGNTGIAMLVILAMVAIASAFINNTPVVVLFIPIIISLSCEFGFSPSKLLMPVSYASILAGTCTLIGTSTNIIVSDLSAMYGYGNLRMFELSTVGVPIALIGIAILYFAAPHLMPGHEAPICEMKESEHRRYLAELTIPRGSRLIGQDPEVVFSDKYSSIEVLEIIRYSHVFYPDRDDVEIAADDLLLVKGYLNDLVAIIQNPMVDLPHTAEGKDLIVDPQKSIIVELIVPPQSSLIGERLMEISLTRDPEINILGIKRTRLHYTEQKIRDINLKTGDILLIQCPESKLNRLRGGTDFIIIEDVYHEIVLKRKARWAISIFLGLIIAATTGIANIMVCALTAVLLMILTGCLQIREAYRSIQADVLILIVGTIALGAAMEKSGATQYYAEAYLKLFHGSPPVIVLAGFLLLTSIGTQLLSNNAIAVLLLPLAISTAVTMGVHPKPFIMAVCFGASACFATPLGYQTNLLVFGPGSYRFIDYLKLGIPLNLLVIIMGTILIPKVWPF